ncbi:hypothetical protein [Curtobacterium luteum]|uniref:hypothetical protein n=1 Tax=Curtobacterium luteum TaxID=33881 RepID=UPI0037FCB021
MNGPEKIARRLHGMQAQIERMGRGSQLGNTTIGGERAVAVADVVTESVVTNEALPDVQQDAADSNESASDLTAMFDSFDEDMDARFDNARADLDDARAEIEEAQRVVSDAFGLQFDGMSEDIQTAIRAAGAAQGTADGIPLILFSTVRGPSNGSDLAPTGSTWFYLDTSNNIAGQWQQTGPKSTPTWTPRQIVSDVIANLDLGKLTAGQAAIAQLVAQKIAASTANFQTVNVSNLFVTSGATMNQATIDYLFANVVQAKKITASMIDVNSLSGITLTGVTVQTGTVGARTILSGTSIKFIADNEVDGGTISATSNGSTRSWMKLGQNQRALVLGPYDLPVSGTVSGYIDSLYVGELYVNNEYDAGTNFRTSGSDTGWRDLPFAAGTSNYDDQHPVQYRVIGKRVELRGWWKRTSGSLTTGVVGTLPAPYRPQYQVLWNAASNGIAYVRMIIDTNGQVNALGVSSSTILYSSLDLAGFYLID